MPNSFTSTAVSESCGAASRRCNSVVLPLPRKPVITFTGIESYPTRSRGMSALLGDAVPCILSGIALLGARHIRPGQVLEAIAV